MTLGIFGDSHAFNISGAWTSLLENHYDVEHHAMYGTSVWNSFKKFKKNYNNLSHIVFTYTNANRIYHLPQEIEHLQFSISPTRIKNVIPKSYEKQMNAVWEAQKIMHDFELDAFINQHVFNDVNSICRQNNIRLINLLPYENTVLDGNFPSLDLSEASGPCITGLRWVSDNESTKLAPDQADHRACHLSDENNKILYKMILGLLNSNEQCTIHLRDSELFVK